MDETLILADWFRNGDKLTPIGAIIAYSVMIATGYLIWRSAKHSGRKWLAEQEASLRKRLSSGWQVVEGGVRFNKTEFWDRCLSGCGVWKLLRPFAHKENGNEQSWLFRLNDPHTGTIKATDDAAIYVIRDPEWDLPGVKLTNRRLGQWYDRVLKGPTPEDFQHQWPELTECWYVELDGGSQDKVEAFLELIRNDLLEKHAVRLARIDFNRSYLACVGRRADSLEAYETVLASGNHMKELLDHVSNPDTN